MTDSDTSFYAKPPDNPLTTLGNAVNISRGVSESNLLRQTLQGRQGMADLYANAPTDPTTGAPDINYLLQNRSKAGFMAPELVQQAQEQAIQQQQLQQQQLLTHQKKMSVGAAGLLSVATNPNAKASDYIDEANNAVASGYFTPEEVRPTFSALTAHLAKGGTVQSFAQEAAGRAIAAGGDPAFGAKLMAGEPGTMDTGAGIQPTRTNILTGEVTPSGSAIHKGLPPTTPVYQGNSARSQPASTVSQPDPFGGQGGAGPGTGPTTASGGNGGGTPSAGGTYLEAPPGKAEAMTELGQASGQQLAGDRAAAGNSINTLTNMHMAYDALSNAPTGRGSQDVQNLKNFAIWAFPSLANTQFGKEAANYDTAVSTLNDQARQLASQFGPKTNDNLDATFAAKPNVEQTKASALALQQKIMSLTRANYAKTMYHDQPFQGLKTGNIDVSDTSPDNYQTYSEQFNRLIDPVAFGADLMPKDKLASYVKGLSTTPDKSTGLSARDRFNNGYNTAITYGFMPHLAAPQHNATGQ